MEVCDRNARSPLFYGKGSKMKIKEVIVVEGKKDLTVLRRAVDAEIITTSGLGLGAEKIKEIAAAQERCGVIVLTDPDYPGKKIRQKLDERIKGLKHAHLARREAYNPQLKKYGVEYATPEAVARALRKAQAQERDKTGTLTLVDLQNWGLVGSHGSRERRLCLGEELGLGQLNGKQFLRRLNAAGYSAGEVEHLLDEFEGESAIEYKRVFT